jgi:hypothetical protein
MPYWRGNYSIPARFPRLLLQSLSDPDLNRRVSQAGCIQGRPQPLAAEALPLLEAEAKERKAAGQRKGGGLLGRLPTQREGKRRERESAGGLHLPAVGRGRWDPDRRYPGGASYTLPSLRV